MTKALCRQKGKLMNKQACKQVLSFLMAFVLFAAALTGCGSPASGKEKDPGKDEVDKNTVFTLVTSPFDRIYEGSTEEFDAGISVSSVMAANGRYYVLYSNYMTDDSLSLLSFDEKGENEKTVSLPAVQDGWINAVTVAPDERVYYVSSAYSEEGETSSMKVCGLSAQGEKLWEKEIEADEDFYIANIVSTEDHTLALTDREIRMYDNADGTEKKLNLPGGSQEGYGGRLCTDGKGGVLYVASGDKGLSAWKLDAQAGTFAQAQLSAEGFWGGDDISSGNGEYDFFSSDQEGVQGFKLDGSAPVKILDYIGSDLIVNNTSGCAMLSPESILLLSYAMDENASPVMLLHKVDPALVGERKVLTLGCVYADDDLRRAVVNYNKTNEQYRIRLVEFSYDEEGNSTFNTEIAAGNIPDIISVSSDMPYESYAAKGLFEDLEPLLDADPDLDKSQFFTNILDAYRLDGKMYFVTPGFSVIGLMGKKKDFKDTRGVTIRQLENMIKEKGIGYDTAMGIMTRESILSWNLYCAMDQYVDWDKGTCSFDSDSFVDLLTFAQKFPQEINYDKIDWEETESNMRAGKQLVRDVYLYGFDPYMSERYGYIGEEVAYMGYPGSGENGPSIMGDMMLAISHQTQEKEACWDFIRQFYLDEYQDNIRFSFPVSRSALQKMAEEAMTPETYTYIDEEGKEVEEVYDQEVISLNGKQFKIPIPTQKDIDEVVKIIESLDNRSSIDTNISNIINEECGAFFAEQKSAKETADVIQSRVKVYLSEIR